MTSLVPSLLRSFVDVDGEALVMHAGEKPYVVGPAGQVELAKRPLTMEAVKGIVSQLLPGDVSHVARRIRRRAARDRLSARIRR